jgi:hypothetical protein
MKKLIVIPLLVLSVGVFAQKFQFGLKAGANLSNFSGVNWDNVDTKPLFGFHGGAFINFLFGDHFMLSPEALFSTQGAKFENTGSKTDYKVSYLAVPVMLRYRFNGGFYVEAGPQVAFKLDEKVDNQSIGNFAKDLDLAIDAGIGWHGNGGFGIGARYVAGISKVGDFNETTAQSPNFRNGVAQLSLFYTLFNNHRD